MTTNNYIQCLYLSLIFLMACRDNSGPVQKIKTSSQIPTLLDSTSKPSFAENNQYILMDTLRISIPPGVNINLENIYNGIYEIRDNVLKRTKWIRFKDFIYLTTSENLGQGIRSYLYVFDNRNKSFVKDSSFKRNYLYSSAGVFIINPKFKRILILGNSTWFDSKQSIITPASIYNIKGAYFSYERNVFKFGEEVQSDSSFISFFNKSMNANDKEILVLPKDWCKEKSVNR